MTYRDFGWKWWVEESVKHRDIKTEIYSACRVQEQNGTSNNGGDWNHHTVIHKIPERHTGKRETASSLCFSFAK